MVTTRIYSSHFTEKMTGAVISTTRLQIFFDSVGPEGLKWVESHYETIITRRHRSHAQAVAWAKQWAADNNVASTELKAFHVETIADNNNSRKVVRL